MSYGGERNSESGLRLREGWATRREAHPAGTMYASEER